MHQEPPQFILSADDPDAAVCVRLWACLKRLRPGGQNDEKIVFAEAKADEMVKWLVEHLGREPAGMRNASAALGVLAELVGAVVTIEQEPLLPLAAGHYRHRVTVRQKRSVWGNTPPTLTLDDLL